MKIISLTILVELWVTFHSIVAYYSYYYILIILKIIKQIPIYSSFGAFACYSFSWNSHPPDIHTGSSIFSELYLNVIFLVRFTLATLFQIANLAPHQLLLLSFPF